MARQMSARRKRVVILGGSIASLSASGSVLVGRHPRILGGYVAIMLVAFVYLIVEFVKLRRSGESCQ